MSIHVERLLNSKRVLLLQGPMGGYFAELADWLTQQGIECYKLNFNGGDSFFYRSRPNTFHYRDHKSQFHRWLEIFLQQHQIDSIVCFGDCRKYHRIAQQVSVKLDIQFFAFEEGYIRPNYLTFEQDGVNFFSNFKNYLYSQPVPTTTRPLDPYIVVSNKYYRMVMSAFFYYFFWILFSFYYPHYQHHREITPLNEFYYWWVAAIRRVYNAIFEEKRFKKLLEEQDQNYFIFALQVHNDFQIRIHSDEKNVETYIEKVLFSFAQHADAKKHLVLKHHPMDRGYRNYTQLIQKYATQYGLIGRVHYFCDIHLPTLLKHSCGMVTVNSTTGIQALFHGIPVKVLGRALYNLPRLSYQGALANFWNSPGEVDKLYFSHFRHELIAYSQLNGAYYGLSPWMRQYQKKTLIVDGCIAQKPSKKKMSKV